MVSPRVTSAEGRPRIGFIGLGKMGTPIAQRLRAAGYPLYACDVNATAVRALAVHGAVAVENPRAVAAAASVIFTCLPGPREVEDVALGSAGVEAGIQPGSLYIDLSTSSPELIRRIATVFRDKGAAVLDAPVSGGLARAAAGTLAVYVGGDERDFRVARPVLESFGSDVRLYGPLGCGEVVKLANNLVTCMMFALLPEAFGVGVKAGISAQALFDAIAAGTGNNEMMHVWFKRILNGNRQPGSHPGVIVKDTRLFLDLAADFGIDVPMARALHSRLVTALERGYGMDLYRLIEERAGIEMKF